jgi:hypothetical protein
VALLLRVSPEERRERETIEIQREFLQNYRRPYGLGVTRVYDDGATGTIPPHEGPEGGRPSRAPRREGSPRCAAGREGPLARTHLAARHGAIREAARRGAAGHPFVELAPLPCPCDLASCLRSAPGALGGASVPRAEVVFELAETGEAGEAGVACLRGLGGSPPQRRVPGRPGRRGLRPPVPKSDPPAAPRLHRARFGTDKRGRKGALQGRGRAEDRRTRPRPRHKHHRGGGRNDRGDGPSPGPRRGLRPGPVRHEAGRSPANGGPALVGPRDEASGTKLDHLRLPTTTAASAGARSNDARLSAASQRHDHNLAWSPEARDPIAVLDRRRTVSAQPPATPMATLLQYGLPDHRNES